LTAIVKNGADYLTMSLRTVQGTAVKMELSGPIRTERVGGRAFSVADVKMTMPQGVAAQKYYVRLVGSYALLFIYSYVDESDLTPLKQILASVAFK
jgi:hypothetical protein